jgi:hypothetical protein
MPNADWEGGSSVSKRHKWQTVKVPDMENGSRRCKTVKCGGKSHHAYAIA